MTKIITTEDKISNNDKLRNLKDFNEVFEFVKYSVNSIYEMKRALIMYWGQMSLPSTAFC